MSSLHLTLLAAVLAGLAACAPGAPRPAASYDEVTRRLVQFASDLDGDGRIDQWTYMDGNRPLRAETDQDGDGRVDRWDYFDASGNLARVGTASGAGGVEDTWTWAPDASGLRRVDQAPAGDRVIVRREFYQGEALIRVEEDAAGAGRIDTWREYREGQLREVRIDTAGRGRPDRQILYDDRGEFAGVFEDVDGDGRFVPVPAPRGVPRP